MLRKILFLEFFSSHLIFSSRFMLFPTFVEEKNNSGGVGGGGEGGRGKKFDGGGGFVEKHSFLISCFRHILCGQCIVIGYCFNFL